MTTGADERGEQVDVTNSVGRSPTPTRRKAGVASVVAVVLFAWGAWSWWHGVWYDHARAMSPDGQFAAESRNRYRWGPLYGWNHFFIRVVPAARIRCKAPKGRWRGTPDSLGEWRHEHHYATYNDFDGSGRFPTGVRWTSEREFVIEGGEGDGSRFELEPAAGR